MSVRLTTEAARFFYEHAGYSYKPGEESPDDGKRRCAKALAKAEEWCMSVGGLTEWEEDTDADRSWMELDDSRPLFGCILRLPCPKCGHCEIKASLWGIDLGPTGGECDDYKRVVEAELALEVMP